MTNVIVLEDEGLWEVILSLGGALMNDVNVLIEDPES